MIVGILAYPQSAYAERWEILFQDLRSLHPSIRLYEATRDATAAKRILTQSGLSAANAVHLHLRTLALAGSARECRCRRVCFA